MEPVFKKIDFTYSKPEQFINVLNTDHLYLDKSKVKDEQVIQFGPLAKGGNHKHPRTEWFIGFGELKLVWINEKGEKQEQLMNPDGQLFLITIPPYLPHAVVNNSSTQTAYLLEYADAKMSDVEKITVI